MLLLRRGIVTLVVLRIYTWRLPVHGAYVNNVSARRCDFGVRLYKTVNAHRMTVYHPPPIRTLGVGEYICVGR